MVQMIESVRSRPRACLVCGSELPAAEEWTAWMCHDCLVLTDADAIRPRPVDFTTNAGRGGSRGSGTPTNFSPSAA
jgi:ribosomal protein L37AE/L43A